MDQAFDVDGDVARRRAVEHLASFASSRPTSRFPSVPFETAAAGYESDNQSGLVPRSNVMLILRIVVLILLFGEGVSGTMGPAMWR